VPRFGISRSGSNLLHVHAVTDVGWCDQLRPIQRKRRTRADHKRNNQLYMKRLQQVLGLWGRQEWPHSVRHGCAVVSQIQDLALMLGADGAHMGLDEARGTNLSPNPLVDMLGRGWCRRGGKRSRYDVNLSSSRTCNTIFVDCLVQDAYDNVAIRIGR
jgi:hypothetical protein